MNKIKENITENTKELLNLKEKFREVQYEILDEITRLTRDGSLVWKYRNPLHDRIVYDAKLNNCKMSFDLNIYQNKSDVCALCLDIDDIYAYSFTSDDNPCIYKRLMSLKYDIDEQIDNNTTEEFSILSANDKTKKVNDVLHHFYDEININQFVNSVLTEVPKIENEIDIINGEDVSIRIVGKWNINYYSIIPLQSTSTLTDSLVKYLKAYKIPVNRWSLTKNDGFSITVCAKSISINKN